jgi:hypothetical protein
MQLRAQRFFFICLKFEVENSLVIRRWRIQNDIDVVWRSFFVEPVVVVAVDVVNSDNKDAQLAVGDTVLR